MRRSFRSRRRGLARAFTLTELLFALGILAIFGLATTQLFYATFRVGHATAQQQNAASAFDSAVSALRADAWIAPEITTPDPATAKLGELIWTINETTLTRDAGDGARPRTWTAPKGMTFAADGASLVLRIPAAPGERGGDLRLISEPMTLAKLVAS